MPDDEKELDEEMKSDDDEEEEPLEKASDSDYVMQALQDETEGLSAYQQAIEATEDPKLKEILEAILDDEKKHNMALEAWAKEHAPDILEEHEGDETDEQEALEDDESIEDADEGDELLLEDDEDAEEGEEEEEKEDPAAALVDDIRAVLAEHTGEDEMEKEDSEDEGYGGSDGEDEDLEKEDQDQDADASDEDGELEKEDSEEEGDEDEGDDEGLEKCSVTKYMPIVKVDDEKHEIYCVVAEPHTFDLQGDRSSPDEIAKAAHRFMIRLQKTCEPGVGFNHEAPVNAYVIENVVTKQDGVKLGDQILKAGTWYQGIKIEDDKLWQMVKSGEITGLSRQGEGIRSPVGKGLHKQYRRIIKSGRVRKMQLNDLSDEDIDRVDLVHKGANGRKIAIIKFISKSKGRDSYMKTKPAGAKTKATQGPVIKVSDLHSIVKSAVAEAVTPLKQENAKLRKAVQIEKEIRLDAERTAISKQHFSAFGSPAETAKILKSIEGIPDEAQRKTILTTMQQANAMKVEAARLLSKSFGSSQPAPDSATAQFSALVDARMSEIRKSAGAPTDQKIVKALAISALTKENPQLAKAVLEEQKAAQFRHQSGME